MADSLEPMSIGAFSSLTRLSVRMLRYYHEHAVLMPAHIDDTGYRWYTRNQLPDALLVRDLRDVGFNISAMAALLAARGTPVFEHALTQQREVLNQEKRAAEQRLQRIDRMLKTMRGETMSNIEIQRKTIPAMTVVTLRGTVPTYSDEGQLWARFMPELARQGITRIGPEGVFEHDPTFVEENPDESVFVPVEPGTTVEAPLEVLEVPEQEVVVARVLGPFSQISDAHSQITTYITQNGLNEAEVDPDGLAGKVFNFYLNDPCEVDDSELLCEVHRPLR